MIYRYIILSVVFYGISQIIKILYLPCICISAYMAIMVIYNIIFDSAKKKNNIKGKDIKDFTTQELVDEILERQNKK